MLDSATRMPRLLDSIRQGNAQMQGEVLQHYRPWLHLLARLETAGRADAKFDASDVVQQTMLEAMKALPRFRGGSEAELLAWLRQVLAHVLAHEIRRYKGTQQRDVGREVSLDQSLAESATRIRNMLVSPGTSPSGRASRNEQEVLLAQVLSQLPPDYREVIILRNMQGLSHEEIATRLGRSPGAVRMLWVRALGQLRQEMEKAGVE